MTNRNRRAVWALAFGFLAVCLLGATADAQSQPAAAPAAVQVWSNDIHDANNGAPGDAPPAIAIVGVRNGTFSGKVMVGPKGPIVGLKATMTDLKGPSAIPAAEAAVRYGTPWNSGVGPRGTDVLLESPLPEFASATAVWVTVSVPKDAKPGDYTGQLTIEAAGNKPAVVPVKLTVGDWTMPDSQDFRTWIEVLQSPDTLAVEYKLPLWTDKHWEMIGKSLELIATTGSRVVYVPLICRTNYGNDETMVRWIKKADGTYDYDYSLMDKYLDLVAKHMGKPKVVIFDVWDVYLLMGKQEAPKDIDIKGAPGSYENKESSHAKALQEHMGKGPVVSLMNPATGKTEANYLVLPRYDDPAAKALWQPVWNEIRKRMKARGLEKEMMLGQLSDYWPNKEEIALFKELSGGLDWASCSHHASRWLSDKAVPKGTLYGQANIGMTDAALDFQYVLNPDKDRHYGWKKPMLHALYWRFGTLSNNTLPWIHVEPECNITGGQRGLAHVGGDFWPAIKSNAGRPTGTVTERYPESYWHSLNVGCSLLAPGPAGPLGTARLEVFRQGIQECEARIAIEAALTDDARKAKLGNELAARAQKSLDERQLFIWQSRGATDDDFQKFGLISQYRTYIFDLAAKWKPTAPAGHKAFLAGWNERSSQLYSLAAEVAKKLGE